KRAEKRLGEFPMATPGSTESGEAAARPITYGGSVNPPAVAGGGGRCLPPGREDFLRNASRRRHSMSRWSQLTNNPSKAYENSQTSCMHSAARASRAAGRFDHGSPDRANGQELLQLPHGPRQQRQGQGERRR